MNPIKEHSDVECIFRYWNRLNIIQHRKITSDMEAAIKKGKNNAPRDLVAKSENCGYNIIKV